jgi:hypothetical protein
MKVMYQSYSSRCIYLEEMNDHGVQYRLSLLSVTDTSPAVPLVVPG